MNNDRYGKHGRGLSPEELLAASKAQEAERLAKLRARNAMRSAASRKGWRSRKARGKPDET